MLLKRRNQSQMYCPHMDTVPGNCGYVFGFRRHKSQSMKTKTPNCQIHL